MKSRQEIRGHGERVLYVDDEEPLLALMALRLERLGYKVTACTNSEQALQIFRADPNQFDVVVSDLSMCGMSGFDLARAILEMRPGVPILLASGHIRPEDNEQARALGLPDLIAKTDAIDELGGILHRLFADRKSGTADPQNSSQKLARRRATGSSSS